LEALYNLASLLEQTRDPAKIVEYADQIDDLEARIIALRPAKKSAEP